MFESINFPGVTIVNDRGSPLTIDLDVTPFAPEIKDSVKRSAEDLIKIPEVKSKSSGSNIQYHLQDEGQSVTFQKSGFRSTGQNSFATQEGRFIVESGGDKITLEYVDPFKVKITLADGTSKEYDGQIAFAGRGGNINPIIYTSGRGENFEITPEVVASFNKKTPEPSEQPQSQQVFITEKPLTANSRNNQTHLW